MRYLKRRIKYIYNNWTNDNFIYQKDNNDKYIGITYKNFIEKSLGYAKFLLDKGYSIELRIIILNSRIHWKKFV